MSKKPYYVIQYGLGPIGAATARRVLSAEPFPLELVGAIDKDPAKAGLDVGELLGLQRETGVRISDDPQAVFADVNADLVLHATSSSLQNVQSQIKSCLRHYLHVISSTEELLFPYRRYPKISTEIDQMAREQECVVVGTGVNPGFVMDTLALTATGICTDIRSISVERVVNAAERRGPLQEKIGAGLTAQSFQTQQEAGNLGHVGLVESLLFLADGLNWKLDRFEETVHPVIAESAVETEFVNVERGKVAGIHHEVKGFVDGVTAIHLDLQMYVGADNPRDTIQIDGDPPIDLNIRNGVFGDTATVGALVNTIPPVMKANPGLHTMKDLAIPRAFATRLSKRTVSSG